MKHAKTPEHNYKRKLRYFQRIGAIPTSVGVHHVSIFHDDWCGIFAQQRCN